MSHDIYGILFAIYLNKVSRRPAAFFDVRAKMNNRHKNTYFETKLFTRIRFSILFVLLQDVIVLKTNADLMIKILQFLRDSYACTFRSITEYNYRKSFPSRV